MKSLTFDDVALVPQFNNVDSRTDPNINSWVTKNHEISFPVIPSNMESVIGEELIPHILGVGAPPIIHRFFKNQLDLIRILNRWGNAVIVSWGVNNVDELVKFLGELPAIPDVCFDVAHGHSKAMERSIKTLKDSYPDIEVIAGNVCTGRGTHDLINWGADAVKVGIGPGCFAQGARVLLSNGFYKNIEDIQVGDRVINGDGYAVEVVGKRKTGIRGVSKLKTNHFYKPTIMTSDHRYLIGNLMSTSMETFNSKGYAALIDQNTRKGQSKIEWSQIGKLPTQSCLLMPRDILFELKDEFEIKLFKRNKLDTTIRPSYESGYIFGTFLGDGHAKLSAYKNSTRGSCTWYFGKNEQYIAEKLNACLYKLFNKEGKIEETDNTIRVHFYYKPLADFLEKFGKRQDKHLPEEYLVDQIDYLTGLFDGLVDSDGHTEDDRFVFNNTSPRLIELFNVCCYLVEKHWPLNGAKKKSAGRLQGCNEENLSQAWFSRTLINPQARLSEKFQIVKAIGYQDLEEEVEVYDLEVACQTHSFIVNNCIVHNSACTTRLKTGFGVPQFSALLDCSEVGRDFKVPIMADGGVRGMADIVKAFAAGASTVMCGKLFAACKESAAEKAFVNEHGMKYHTSQVEHSGLNYMARYRGQASQSFQDDYFGKLKKGTVAEGEEMWIPVTGSVSELIQDIKGSLGSALTYAGARDLREFRKKVKWTEVSNSYLIESGIRG